MLCSIVAYLRSLADSVSPGGASCQSLIEAATRDEVYERVRKVVLGDENR